MCKGINPTQIFTCLIPAGLSADAFSAGTSAAEKEKEEIEVKLYLTTISSSELKCSSSLVSVQTGLNLYRSPGRSLFSGKESLLKSRGVLSLCSE